MATVVGMWWMLRISVGLIAVSAGVFFFKSQHPVKKPLGTDRQALASAEEKLFRKVLHWAIFFTAGSFFTSIGRPYVQTFLAEE